MQLTQTDFGRLLYAGMRTVQDWEHGKRRMPALAWEFINLIQAYPDVQRRVREWRGEIPPT
jgi:DNA-binding transcriptional regulator YiaG